MDSSTDIVGFIEDKTGLHLDTDTSQKLFRIISRQRLLASGVRQSVRDPYDDLPLIVKRQLVEYLLTPEQKQMVADLKQDLGRVRRPQRGSLASTRKPDAGDPG